MVVISQSFKGFLSRVNQFILNARGPVWFRGHSNRKETGVKEDHKLISSLFRTDKGLKEIKRKEMNYIFEFMTKGYSLHKTKDKWELLYLMQHHGVPTRLLDWTRSLSVALYFATKKWDPCKNQPSIWLLLPDELNKYTVGCKDLIIPGGGFQNYVSDRDLSTHAIAPVYNTPRLIVQQGQFTLQGNFTGDLNEELKLITGNYSRVLLELELNENIYNDIQSYLYMNGINKFSLFPDLDGLSKSIKYEQQ